MFFLSIFAIKSPNMKTIYDISLVHFIQFGGSEAIITALSDEFPKIGRHREIFVAGLFSLYFIVGLASCTQGGFYYFQLLDRYAAGYSILIAVLFETIAVSWIYGTNRFCDDIRDMVGFYPGIYWRVCWKFVAPIFLLFIIVYGLLQYQPLQYDNYYYPDWANTLGWCIAGSSVMMIPLVAIIQILKTRGTFRQVSDTRELLLLLLEMQTIILLSILYVAANSKINHTMAWSSC